MRFSENRSSMFYTDEAIAKGKPEQTLAAAMQVWQS